MSATEIAAKLVDEWREYFGLNLPDVALGELTRRIAFQFEDCAIDRNAHLQRADRACAERDRLCRTLQVIADHPGWADHSARASAALAEVKERA